MGSVQIRYSNLPAIARAIPREEEAAIDDFATELMDYIKSSVWKLRGFVAASVKDHSLDPLHADIWVGEVGAIGFYSGFNEFGTVKQAPRPVVGPAAHAMEPRLIAIVTDHIRKAADAK
jgi:HK97 gp10 family phage protein